MVSRSYKNLWKTLLLLSDLTQKIKNLPRHHRVYILPTRHGLAFLLALFFLFLLALTYGHSLAFAAAFFLTSLLMSSALLTNLNLKGLEISQISLPDVMRLEEFEDLQCLIKNKNRRARFDLMVESWGANSCDAFVLKECPGEQEAWVRSALKIDQRGAYQASKITLSTTFPLGLFRAWMTFPLKSSVHIAPKAREHGRVHEEWLDIQEDEHSVQFKARDNAEDFYQHSFFHQGESWKKIDWKAWATKDQLLKKDYFDRSQNIVCYFQENQNIGPSFGLEQQLETLSWWLKKQESGSQLFIVRIEDDQKYQFGPAMGKDAVAQILKVLATVTRGK